MKTRENDVFYCLCFVLKSTIKLNCLFLTRFLAFSRSITISNNESLSLEVGNSELYTGNVKC